MEKTEEELYEKCFQEVLNRKISAMWHRQDHINVAKLYHSERLKLSLPTEDQINKVYPLSDDLTMNEYNTNQSYSRSGAKWLRNKLLNS